METIKPGETVTNMNPGGGGYGNPYERPIEKVVWDVKNGLVSIKGAQEDYGVVIANPETLEVDKQRHQGAACGGIREGDHEPFSSWH